MQRLGREVWSVPTLRITLVVFAVISTFAFNHTVSLPLIGLGLIYNLWMVGIGLAVLLVSMYGWSLEPHTDPDAGWPRNAGPYPECHR